MIWTGSKAVMVAIVGEIILRLITVIWVLRIGIGWLLSVKNSKTMIRKTRQAASRWEKITLGCFWNAKSDQRYLLRSFIIVYNYMLFTMLLPLGAMLLYYAGILPIAVPDYWSTSHFFMNVSVSVPTCIYILRRFGN